MGKNSLSGPIPESVGALTNLAEIALQSNRLTGQIPDLSYLLKLRVLNLAQNLIDGPIPESLENPLYAGVKYLDLSHNNISGVILTYL